MRIFLIQMGRGAARRGPREAGGVRFVKPAADSDGRRKEQGHPWAPLVDGLCARGAQSSLRPVRRS